MTNSKMGKYFIMILNDRIREAFYGYGSSAPSRIILFKNDGPMLYYKDGYYVLDKTQNVFTIERCGTKNGLGELCYGPCSDTKIVSLKKKTLKIPCTYKSELLVCNPCSDLLWDEFIKKTLENEHKTTTDLSRKKSLNVKLNMGTGTWVRKMKLNHIRKRFNAIENYIGKMFFSPKKMNTKQLRN